MSAKPIPKDSVPQEACDTCGHVRDALPPCTYPVYDLNRYHKWPHMGPCGLKEEHSHE